MKSIGLNAIDTRHELKKLKGLVMRFKKRLLLPFARGVGKRVVDNCTKLYSSNITFRG